MNDQDIYTILSCQPSFVSSHYAKTGDVLLTNHVTVTTGLAGRDLIPAFEWLETQGFLQKNCKGIGWQLTEKGAAFLNNH